MLQHIRKKRQKRSRVGVNMCEWIMKLFGRKPKEDLDFGGKKPKGANDE